MSIRSIILATIAPLALAATVTAQPVGTNDRAAVSALSGQAFHSHFGASIGFGNHSIITIGSKCSSGHGSGGCAPPPCAKTWIPGYYEFRTEQYVVAARYERRWVAPVYAFETTPCGQTVRVLVCAGHFARVLVEPERIECRRVRVWVPGHYA